MMKSLQVALYFRAPLGMNDLVEARALQASCSFFSLFDLEQPLIRIRRNSELRRQTVRRDPSSFAT